MKTGAICVTLAGLLLCGAAPADELKLKDGSTIVGRIVGFEGDSFKVETSYGFALVRRDSVASIKVEEEKKPPAKTEPAKAEAPKPAPTPPPVETPRAAPPAKQEQPPAKIAPAPPPAPPPEPVIRETVSGTLYTNHTYGFHMYKPPSWRVIEGARRLLPSAIVAMGTSDETTLMVLGRGRASGTLDAHVAETDRQLRQVYGNYRVVNDQRTVVAGVPAVERRFYGNVDDRSWSCVLVSFQRGGDVFTILGMTTSDSDLVQIQENVIAKTLGSLQFEIP